jgi:hypothetical protein
MGRGDRQKRDKEKKERGGKRNEAQAQQDLVNNMMEQIRTMDSEIDLLKQHMNLIVKELHAIRNAVLKERKDVRSLSLEQEEEKSRFQNLVSVIKGMKGE